MSNHFMRLADQEVNNNRHIGELPKYKTFLHFANRGMAETPNQVLLAYITIR